MPYLGKAILDDLERRTGISETPHLAFALALPDSVSVSPPPKCGRPRKLIVDGAPGNQVHPSESLAASYFPWLAQEWHPTRNELRPDQVTRASGRKVIWRCSERHEWAAVVYARTLSRSGCPTCYAIETPERIKTGKRRARQVRDEQATARVAALIIEARLDDA